MHGDGEGRGPQRLGATAACVTALGLLVAFAGAEHGVGELAQAPGSVDTLVFESWPDAEDFRQLSGEPAMTVLPDLVASGSATLVVSTLMAGLAIGLRRLRHAGPMFVALSVLLLLVGGGLAPPLIGVLLGLSWTSAPAFGRVLARHRWARALSRWWRPALAVTVAAYLSLFPGTVLLHAVWDIESTALVLGLTAAAFSGLVITLLAAVTNDAVYEGPVRRARRGHQRVTSSSAPRAGHRQAAPRSR